MRDLIVIITMAFTAFPQNAFKPIDSQLRKVSTAPRSFGTWKSFACLLEGRRTTKPRLKSAAIY